MSEIPRDFKYTKTHEWVRVEADGAVTVGITDHAQDLLGDLVFVELPEVGQSVAAQAACAVVESVKAASDAYAPLSGQVTEVNADLAESPERINTSPYDEGWLFRMRPAEPDAVDTLMSAEDYQALLEREG